MDLHLWGRGGEGEVSLRKGKTKDIDCIPSKTSASNDILLFVPQRLLGVLFFAQRMDNQGGIGAQRPAVQVSAFSPYLYKETAIQVADGAAFSK
jgi:hypothetical protein